MINLTFHNKLDSKNGLCWMDHWKMHSILENRSCDTFTINNIMKIIRKFSNTLLETIRVKSHLTNCHQTVGWYCFCFITERHFTNIADLIIVTVIFCANCSSVLVFKKLSINNISTNWTNKTSRVIKWITRTNKFEHLSIQYKFKIYPTSKYWSSIGLLHCLQSLVSSKTATLTISPCGSLLLVILLLSSLAWWSVLL